MSDLDPKVRDRAAQAAHDVFTEVVLGPDARSAGRRSFEVSIVGWRAVVDAVAEVLAAELRADNRKLSRALAAVIVAKEKEMTRVDELTAALTEMVLQSLPGRVWDEKVRALLAADPVPISIYTEDGGLSQAYVDDLLGTEEGER